MRTAQYQKIPILSDESDVTGLDLYLLSAIYCAGVGTAPDPAFICYRNSPFYCLYLPQWRSPLLFALIAGTVPLLPAPASRKGKLRPAAPVARQLLWVSKNTAVSDGAVLSTEGPEGTAHKQTRRPAAGISHGPWAAITPPLPTRHGRRHQPRSLGCDYPTTTYPSQPPAPPRSLGCDYPTTTHPSQPPAPPRSLGSDYPTATHPPQPPAPPRSLGCDYPTTTHPPQPPPPPRSLDGDYPITRHGHHHCAMANEGCMFAIQTLMESDRAARVGRDWGEDGQQPPPPARDAFTQYTHNGRQ